MNAGYVANQTRKVTCSVPNCDRKVKTAGKCGMHYQRWRKYGNVETRKRAYLPSGTALAWLQEQIANRDRTAGCWEWPFPKFQSGHGQIHYQGGPKSAHSISLLLATGSRPEPPQNNALHSCDNPPCVNPAHLRWGTHKDNAQDRTERGRQHRGEGSKNAKLTESQVRAILSDPRSHTAISADFNVTRTNIGYIKRGMAWKHLQGGPNA